MDVQRQISIYYRVRWRGWLPQEVRWKAYAGIVGRTGLLGVECTLQEIPKHLGENASAYHDHYLGSRGSFYTDIQYTVEIGE